jgi:hypothetical protein
MTDRRATRWMCVGMTMAALGGLQACKRDAASGQPPPLAAGNVQRPECPHAWGDTVSLADTSEIGNGPPVTTSTRVASPEFTPLRDVPEVNDCQAFIVPAGDLRTPASYVNARAVRYGPLMAIFVGKRFDSMRDSTVWEAAQVFAWAPAFYYQPLGLGPLHNCLYLWRVRGRWSARMVQRRVTPGCNDVSTLDALPPGTDLAVKEAQRGPFTSSADYPTAAVWEWDATHQIQYIGVRCGNAWCRVGRQRSGAIAEFEPEPPYIPTPAGLANPDDRVRYAGGWKDRQRLAVPHGDSVVPSNVIGTIFPASNLGEYPTPGNFNQFRVVAYVALEDPTGDAATVALYRQKFNYDVAPMGSSFAGMTELSICWGTPTSCRIAEGARPELEKHCKATVPSATVPSDPGVTQQAFAPTDPQATWWARLRSPRTQTTMYRCVTRRVSSTGAMSADAAARLRWVADDETSWNYCADGCCEVPAKSK